MLFSALNRCTILAALVSVTTIGIAATADEICTIKERGTVSSIAFPDGHEITIIGHQHGVTAEVMGLARLADDKSSSNEKFLTSAKMKLAALNTTLQSYRNEVSFIRDQIDNGKIQFIALEYGDQIMEALNQQTKLFLPLAKSNFAERGLHDDQLIDDSFLVFAAPAHYLVNMQPDLLKNVKLAPVEDDDLMQESLDQQSMAATFLEAFNQENPTLEKAMNEAFVSVMLNYDQHQFLKDDWLYQRLAKDVPAAKLESAKGALSYALGAVEQLRERDAKSSKKILALKGSGVLLIGAAHVKSLSRVLRDQCLRISAK